MSSALRRGEQIVWRDIMPIAEHEAYAAQFTRTW